MANRVYTEADRERVRHLSNLLTLRWAAEESGIPKDTLRYWASKNKFRFRLLFGTGEGTVAQAQQLSLANSIADLSEITGVPAITLERWKATGSYVFSSGRPGKRRETTCLHCKIEGHENCSQHWCACANEAWVPPILEPPEQEPRELEEAEDGPSLLVAVYRMLEEVG